MEHHSKHFLQKQIAGDLNRKPDFAGITLGVVLPRYSSDSESV